MEINVRRRDTQRELQVTWENQSEGNHVGTHEGRDDLNKYPEERDPKTQEEAFPIPRSSCMGPT